MGNLDLISSLRKNLGLPWVWVAGMLVFSLTGMPGLSWAEKERLMSHGKDVQHFPSVGPGDAPHVHELPLDRLMRVEDISKSPDQLPPPIQRDQPGTVHDPEQS